MLVDLGRLSERLRAVPDVRRARGKRYALVPVLLLLTLAKLAGEDTLSGMADWISLRQQALRAALGRHWPRMPHHNPDRRVLAHAVAPAALDEAVGACLCAPAGAGQSVVVSIDGKTLRGTIASPGEQGEHLIADYLPQEGVVLLQVATGAQENEISVAPTLLQALELRGTVVTGDAMHTQRALSVQILAAGGDYRWIARENQPTLREEIAALFELDDHTVAGGRLPGERRTATTVEQGHGRQERRTLTASTDRVGCSDWPHLAQVFRLTRQRRTTKTGKEEGEVVYGLTSLPPARADAATLLARSRWHWGIENGLHYRRDVTFHEDATRLTQGHAGRVMAALNNLVFGLLRHAGHTNLAAARRRCSADLDHALALLTAPGRT
jgi:predicted transposase YbfD/YdcC